jgi:hypothetical protein
MNFFYASFECHDLWMTDQSYELKSSILEIGKLKMIYSGSLSLEVLAGWEKYHYFNFDD